MAGSWKPPPVGTPCWVEIPTTGSVDELKDFYHNLFPSWEFRPSHGGTGTEDGKQMAHFTTPQGLSGGIVKLPPDVQVPDQAVGCGMTVYFLVSNLEEINAKVHSLGGTTCKEKTQEGPNAWFMNFRDPRGNRFGAYQFGEAS